MDKENKLKEEHRNAEGASPDGVSGTVALRSYAIHISGKLVKVDQPTATGRELKKFGDVPEGNDLFLKVPGGTDRGITDDETVELKNGMHFYDLPPSNLGGLD